ncbi:helix-turn-helix domain-containing protein [Virgibacillus sp. CBA3643]|uniref:helix-turn-helix domain-containing protein n=1 Tax=Virgibacillus sp. CBA3643 TaxID=2942278 RepID=UPI0035A33BAF
MEFGAVLQRMRKESGISQEEMSLKLHKSRSSISKLETNKLELRATDLVNWCRITNNPDVMMGFIYGQDAVLMASDVVQSIGMALITLGGIL